MVTQEIKHGIFYIHVEGDIFAVTTVDLKNAFEESWRKKIFQIVLNLEKSHLINSSGIGVIVGALKTCRETYNDGDLVIVNPPHHIKRTLRIMGIDQFIPTKESLLDAEKYFRNKRFDNDSSLF